MDKIISVDKPKEKKSRWNLFIIHYEDSNGKTYDSCMFEEEYNVTMFKRYLIEIGTSEEELDKYEKLLYKHWNRERM